MVEPRPKPGPQEALLQAAALAMLALTALALGWVLFTRTHPSRADALGLALRWPVPPFSLTDQAGKEYGADRLAGRVAVVDFIYTRCGASCPTLTSQMALLQRKFRGQAGLQLLSVTVDPLHDTPAVLARYARQYGADFANWSFLSGPSARIDGLMQQGFKLQVEHLSVDERGDQLVDIPHTSTVALVDRHGLIRAYYEGVEEASWPKLAQGVAALLAEP